MRLQADDQLLGLIEETGVWAPDAARRLIKHQALKRGANCIINYREEPWGEEGEIKCYGEAVWVSGRKAK